MSFDPKNTTDKVKVIDSLWAFILATAVAGPFALPLFWRNPRYKKSTKIWISIIVILFTLFLVFVAGTYLDGLLTEYKGILNQAQ
jgi:uncharacterized membrane protein